MTFPIFTAVMVAAALSLVPVTVWAGPGRASRSQARQRTAHAPSIAHSQRKTRRSRRSFTPASSTPITGARLVDELAASHTQVFGREPSPDRLAVAWSQCALESGRGLKSRDFDLCGVQRQRFGSHREAGRAYWRIVRRFPAALAAMDRGDAGGAAEALGGRYYRASVERYRAGMVALKAEYEAGKR